MNEELLPVQQLLREVAKSGPLVDAPRRWFRFDNRHKRPCAACSEPILSHQRAVLLQQPDAKGLYFHESCFDGQSWLVSVSG